MFFFSLINAERATLATDRLVIPASKVDALPTALDAARRLSGLHERMDERVRSAEREGREAGHRDGLARGELAAAERLTERLLELERGTEAEREALRARSVDDALDVVRRIAASLGDAETLAALALQASRELLPCGAIAVQVHPDRLEEVRERLTERRRGKGGGGPVHADGASASAKPPAVAGAPGVTLHVEAEASLEPGECRLRSSNGATVLAGLETQLRRIERHALAAPGFAS